MSGRAAVLPFPRAHTAFFSALSRNTALRVVVPDRDAAQRQFWRHVANRACLAILADVRYPVEQAGGSSDATRPPQGPPRIPLGSDVFQVRAEPLEIVLGERRHFTVSLKLDLHVPPALLSPGNWLTLAALRDWPPPQTTDVLFRYRASRQTFERREGLSGDVVYLFEMLLRPHAREMLEALDIPPVSTPKMDTIQET